MVPVNSVSMMEKRLRIMMGTIFVLLDGVFLLLLFAWLVRETEAGKGFWSKAYHMLLLSLMKVDITMAQGMEYVRISLSHIFKSYRYNTIGAQRILQKEQRLRSLSRSCMAARRFIRRKKSITERFWNRYNQVAAYRRRKSYGRPRMDSAAFLRV